MAGIGKIISAGAKLARGAEKVIRVSKPIVEGIWQFAKTGAKVGWDIAKMGITAGTATARAVARMGKWFGKHPNALAFVVGNASGAALGNVVEGALAKKGHMTNEVKEFLDFYKEVSGSNDFVEAFGGIATNHPTWWAEDGAQVTVIDAYLRNPLNAFDHTAFRSWTVNPCKAIREQFNDSDAYRSSLKAALAAYYFRLSLTAPDDAALNAAASTYIETICEMVELYSLMKVMKRYEDGNRVIFNGRRAPTMALYGSMFPVTTGEETTYVGVGLDPAFDASTDPGKRYCAEIKIKDTDVTDRFSDTGMNRWTNYPGAADDDTYHTERQVYPYGFGVKISNKEWSDTMAAASKVLYLSGSIQEYLDYLFTGFFVTDDVNNQRSFDTFYPPINNWNFLDDDRVTAGYNYTPSSKVWDEIRRLTTTINAKISANRELLPILLFTGWRQVECDWKRDINSKTISLVKADRGFENAMAQASYYYLYPIQEVTIPENEVYESAFTLDWVKSTPLQLLYGNIALDRTSPITPETFADMDELSEVRAGNLGSLIKWAGIGTSFSLFAGDSWEEMRTHANYGHIISPVMRLNQMIVVNNGEDTHEWVGGRPTTLASVRITNSSSEEAGEVDRVGKDFGSVLERTEEFASRFNENTMVTMLIAKDVLVGSGINIGQTQIKYRDPVELRASMFSNDMYKCNFLREVGATQYMYLVSQKKAFDELAATYNKVQQYYATQS